MRLDSLTARLALALLSTSVASGCVVPATLVEVIVETDMPGDGPFDLRVYAREGDRPFGTDTPARSNASINMVARYLRNGSAPSFVLVPRQGAARDGSMTARIEAESGETVLRRDVRFRFVPNQHGYLRIVLRSACALPDTRCRVVEPCTRQAVCEENGQTCGDNGACVSTLVAPSGTRPRPVVPPPFDGGTAVEGGADACVPTCPGVRCGESDGCGGVCNGPCAGGERCVDGRCECSPGFTSCGGMCRPDAEVECTMGMTRAMSCGACGTRMDSCGADCRWSSGMCSGGGSCMPGENQSERCGNCGSRSRSCQADCTWGAFGACSGEGACAAGQSQSQACGNCGTQTRMCQADCSWGTYSACSGAGPCSPGQTQTQACGNCGTQSRTCAGTCQWPAWGACTGQGVCAAGSTRAGCDRCGVEVCSASCTWGACQPSAGSQCLHSGGTNYRSCSRCRNGAQFCLSSCVWSTACCSLGSCPSCL